MKKAPRIACLRPTLNWFSVSGLAFVCILDIASRAAVAQSGGNVDPTQSVKWAAGAIAHAQQMRTFPDPDHGAQPTPPVIPRHFSTPDPAGALGTFQPNGATFTANNAFFANLGTNGRTCFSCHQPQDGWGVSAANVAARFAATGGTDPIFRLVDGATCPSDNVSTPQAKRQAYQLLIDKGLIRIGLPIPTSAQFAITSVNDPYSCNTNPATGLTSPSSGIVSIYRRPLPATNLGFLSAIMWDGREPSLTSQATDATLGHAQANPNTPPTPEQLAQIVAFETGIFTAQALEFRAGDLADGGSKGGPIALSLQLASFFIGVNDPLGHNPNGTPFTSQIFDLYRPWLGPTAAEYFAQRQSIARGEEVFNNTNINIAGVSGLNDDLNLPSIPGFCGTCHDTPNVGNHSVKAPLDIGIPDAGGKTPPVLDISGLPVFTLTCTAGPLAGQIYVVTDPGRALISGQCKDIGRLKGPILRGLAGRAPYFHNGSAATLLGVVNFYDQRFGIGFTDQQKQDLVNFLNSL